MKRLFGSLRTSSLLAGLSALMLCGASIPGATLNVAASETASAGLYDYSYTFSLTGTGTGFDNIFLGSDDLSPLNVQILLNGAATTDWSYLGNNTPENYLQFFSQSATPLSVGSSLKVSFASSFRPGSGFAVGLNSLSGVTSNEVTGITTPTAVPEPPTAFGMVLAASLTLLCLGVKRLANC